MLRLEQIRLLENRIQKAVKYIEVLREENAALKRSVDSAQKRMQELENLVSQFKTDQDEIEKSILRAIRNLDRLEDQIVVPVPGEAAAPAEEPAAENGRQEASPPAGAPEEEAPSGAPGRGPGRGRNRPAEPEPEPETPEAEAPDTGASLFDPSPAGDKKPELDIF